VQQQKDAENGILARGEHTFAILNTFPYNTGHIMVVPYRHIPDLEGLNSSEMLEIMQMARKVLAVLKEVYHPDGYNLGINLGRAAGAGIADHLHLHIVPRWNGDTNFMPVLSDVKVVPESLEETYRRLKPVMDRYPLKEKRGESSE
jgi:ATP adenylyltransferase